MREKLDKIISSKFGIALNKFYTSVWHIVVFAVICILCRTFEKTVLAAALITILTVPAFLFCKNLVVLIPFLTQVPFALTENTMPYNNDKTGYYDDPIRIAVLIVSLILLVSALVFNLVYFGKWRVIFKKAYLTISLCLATSALMLGGVTSGTFDLMGVGAAAAYGFSMFLPYAVLINGIEYEGKKTIKLFAWATIIASIVIGTAVLREYYVNDFNFDTYVKGYLLFGFAVSNSAAALVLIAIPFTFYFVYIYKYGYLFMLLVALEIFIIVMTYSRGSLVFALPGSVIISIVLCFKKKTGRLGYWITMGIIVAAVGIMLFLLRYKIFDAITTIKEDGINDSQRFELWDYGFKEWLNQPIFGLGMWFLVLNGFTHTSFHCTPLTYLFCGGLLGGLAYLYHRYKTIRLVFSAKLTPERVFCALSILGTLLNALLDVGMTSAPHLLFYAITLALIEFDVNEVRKQNGLPVLYDQDRVIAAYDKINVKANS